MGPDLIVGWQEQAPAKGAKYTHPAHRSGATDACSVRSWARFIRWCISCCCSVAPHWGMLLHLALNLSDSNPNEGITPLAADRRCVRRPGLCRPSCPRRSPRGRAPTLLAPDLHPHRWWYQPPHRCRCAPRRQESARPSSRHQGRIQLVPLRTNGAETRSSSSVPCPRRCPLRGLVLAL